MFATYHEYDHVGHSLGFLQDYLANGQRPLCPDHELAHYFVFMKHGEVERAEEAFGTAQNEYRFWQANIKADPATNTDQQLIDQAQAYYQRYSAAIANDQTNISESELRFLTFLGNVCVKQYTSEVTSSAS